MNELQRRAMEGAAKYLELRGCVIVNADFEDFIVFEDGAKLVFGKVRARVGDKYPSVRITRREYERVMLKWFASDFEHIDMNIRADAISMAVLAGDKALVRHEIGAAVL